MLLLTCQGFRENPSMRAYLAIKNACKDCTQIYSQIHLMGASLAATFVRTPKSKTVPPFDLDILKQPKASDGNSKYFYK